MEKWERIEKVVLVVLAVLLGAGLAVGMAREERREAAVQAGPAVPLSIRILERRTYLAIGVDGRERQVWELTYAVNGVVSNPAFFYSEESLNAYVAWLWEMQDGGR